MDIPPLCSSSLPISASSLIATLHQTFANTEYRSLRIDSTSILVLGPNVEPTLLAQIWEHAYRRSEDQALFVVPTDPSASTAFFSAVSAIPDINPSVLQALNVITPFLTALTPKNLSTRFHNGLSIAFSLNSKGETVSARMALSEKPFTSLDQLLYLPSKENNRIFDVFYHVLLAESEERGTYLSLKSSPDQYELLRKSGTYKLPEWVMFSDDYALAKDWSDALRQCGFKGTALRGVLSTISGILLLGNKDDPNDLAEGASLVGIDPSIQKKYSREQLIVSSYVALVQGVISQLNKYLASLDLPHVNDAEDDPNEIVSVVTLVEGAEEHKKVILRNVFDNSSGINAELANDGVKLTKTPQSVMKALDKPSSISSSRVSPIPNFKEILDSSLSFISQSSLDVETETLDIPGLISANRVWTILNVSPCYDAAGLAADTWSSSAVSAQIRELFVTQWAQKRGTIDFTTDFDFYEFLEHYSPILPPNIDLFHLEEWARQEKNWDPTQFFLGTNRLWIAEDIWRDLELGLEHLEGGKSVPVYPFDSSVPSSESVSQQNYALPVATSFAPSTPYHTADQKGPLTRGLEGSPADSAIYADDRGYEEEEDDDEYTEEVKAFLAESKEDLERQTGKVYIRKEKQTTIRRFWVAFVWLLTFWMPSFILKYIFRMKRSDVRMAWREKIVICFMIFLLNAAIVFYMIFLDRVICPNFDKVWNIEQLSTHRGTNDVYVAIHGNVYDITKFYRLQHSDSSIQTTPELMMEFAGQDISDYFIPPLTVACRGLVSDETIQLDYNTSVAPLMAIASHHCGPDAIPPPEKTCALYNINWYTDIFQPAIKKFYIGRLVASKTYISMQGNENNQYWSVIDGTIYDLTNYMITVANHPKNEAEAYIPYSFLPGEVVDMFENNQGGDITSQFYGNSLDAKTRSQTLNCLNNAFVAGEVDFRDSARCQAANWILLAMAGILASVIVIKFLTSIRFGSKRLPSPQDKFVICQIPAYTESEDELRLAIDSLTGLRYDNRRKLLFVICDGMIVGRGNDMPTPRIVLDIFGIDSKIDSPSFAYNSIGEGRDQLNYAKVYSGLYENEGDVVPFVVVVKVGRDDEKFRPGNRGKRDSQIILMNFLNRVHYQRPMSPLDLEIFHHINNVIGVDPEFYEFLFMVDADTSVREDSLTRLVAACSDDLKIAGICGETGLQNEEKSWTTMIQVYEYFISHHLTKAFESMFGSVTCLPGCFSMYRLKTAKKYKPLIISDEIIREYSINHVDTLHKKNLFSLGEDRYLTTLMAKYFPKMKFTFVSDAYAQTAVPVEFDVLLSQRRRWINSTVHNLVELLRLNNMCGFPLFSMRGVVFIDLIGTLMLPAVVIYLGYLIYLIASHSGPLPLISIILISSVYGLQALVFVLRRQWQHIGWMLIYIAAYPIHSFILPIYSFWNMDNFTWGNTRVVMGEGKEKIIAQPEDEKFDPSTIPMETWASYASRNNLPGAERQIVFDERKGKLQNPVYTEEGYEMREFPAMRDGQTQEGISMYSRDDFRQSEYRNSRPFSTFSADMLRNGTPDTANPNRVSHHGVPHSVSGFSLARPEEAVYDEGRDAPLKETIKNVLAEADLDSMTKRQLREKVEDIMGVEFTPERIQLVDKLIDEELENLE